MMVRAIQAAFIDGRRVRVGDLVDVPDGYKAAWAVPATQEAPVAAPRPARKRENVALSQVARERTKGPLDELV